MSGRVKELNDRERYIDRKLFEFWLRCLCTNGINSINGIKSNSNATTSECVCVCVSIQITKHSRCSIFLRILLFSHTYTYTHKHTRTLLFSFCISHPLLESWVSLALVAFHHCSHSKWIGNKSAPGENMFCMRFDVVCFWWLKEKILFLYRTPNTFRKSLLRFSCWLNFFFSHSLFMPLAFLLLFSCSICICVSVSQFF